MEKAFEIQKQARDNAQSFQTYLTGLQNWETEMKRKEAALNGEFEQDLPPVRSKVKKETPVVPPKITEKRLSASDYKAWEQFDVDEALEKVDMYDAGPSSLDSKKSESDKKEKLREESLYQKERGNKYVKEGRWDDAISCYNRAIELVKDDAVYFANRGLCYLKKERLHEAERDCTEALKLDPTYVKGYQRRAAAREKLGSLKGASEDLEQVLLLEPHNKAAAIQLRQIINKMGTKGTKSKSSATVEIKPMEQNPLEKIAPKIVEIDGPIVTKEKTALDKWKEGVGEDIAIIKPAIKPPHLRSKKPLIQIPITEIHLGCNKPEVPKNPTTTEKKENYNNNIENNNNNAKDVEFNLKGDIINGCSIPESKKLISEEVDKEKSCIDCNSLVPPTSNLQFTTDWKSMKNHPEARSYYLNLIEPSKIPSIFANALESDHLAEIIRILFDYRDKFKHKAVSYLQAFVKVKRFSALSLFLSTNDKNCVNQLLIDYGSEVSNEEMEELRKKYEL